MPACTCRATIIPTMKDKAMQRHIRSTLLMLFIFAAMFPCGLQAQTDYDSKPLPVDGVITQPGLYHLENDLAVSRDQGIVINADDVTLDLRGHALRYTGTPRPGVFGIVAGARQNVHITNGSVGGFWFGLHCTQNTGLRIDDVRFDDIPYLAVNVAQSKNVTIRGCTFTNFRYDIHKEKDTYVIGINIGGEDVVISDNTFIADYAGPDPQQVGMETVFVLFSANVSQRCVVALNEMSANVVLPRSYGVWVASNAHVTASYNTIRNMKYGICLGSNASGLAGFNHFLADPPPAGTELIDSVGVSASGAKEIGLFNNVFDGLTTDANLPEDQRGARVGD